MTSSHGFIFGYDISLCFLPSRTSSSSVSMPNEDAEVYALMSEEGRKWMEQYPLHDSDCEIHTAAYKGDVALVTSILENNTTATTNIDARNRNDCTPLHLAIRADHGSVVQLLLEAGSDPTIKDDIEPAYCVSLSALDLAAWLGQPNALAALLDHDISISPSTLFFAASKNHVDCLALILEKHGTRDFSDMSRLEAVRLAIERAALCWHEEAFELLLDYYHARFPDPIRLNGNGAALGKALICALYDYDCDDRCRPPAVCCPLDKSLSSIMKSLVKAGADVNTRDDQGRHSTAFWACLHMPHVPRDVVRFLLENGLHVHHVSPDQDSPLCGIISDANDDPSLVEDLISAGASVSGTNEDGYTPLHLAAHVSFAEVLIANGADISARTPQGQTPLHTACEHGNISVVKLLLTHGANVHDVTSGKSHRSDIGWTPLLFAVGFYSYSWWYCSNKLEERLQLVQLLHSHGADLHISASDGFTALHRAAQCGNEKLVRYFIDSGADVCAKTTSGTTALHYVSEITLPADEAKATSIIGMLLEHGAEVNAMNQEGKTPLLNSVAAVTHASEFQFSPAVCNLLLEKGAERTASNVDGKTMVDMVNDSHRWIFGEDGLVRKKPPPVHVAPNRGRGRGRGMWPRGG